MSKSPSPLSKLTTLFVVDQIEPCLATWNALGYAVTVRVPEAGALDFAILQGATGEVMFQTKASLQEDMADVAQRVPSYVLYADVHSLAAAKACLKDAEVLIGERKTFYGATESWVVLPGGMILGLAERS